MTMSSLPTIAKPASVTILNSAEDWHRWIKPIQQVAEKEDLWETIKPGENTTGSESLTRPLLPSYAHVKPGARSLRDLTQPDEKEDYRDRMRRYELEISEYNRKSRALADLYLYIYNSVSPSYQPMLEATNTCREALSILSTFLCPTNEARKHEVTRQYLNAKLYTRNQNFHKWLMDYQVVYQKAKALSLIDVADERAHEDLIRSVKVYDSGAGDRLQAIYRDEMKAKKVGSIATYIAETMEWLSTYDGLDRSTNISHSAHATFQGKAPFSCQCQNDTQDTPRKCLCGEYHRFRDCPYLNEAVRPFGWTAKKEVEDEIKQKIDNGSDGLRKAVRIASGKGKRMEQEGGQQSPVSTSSPTPIVIGSTTWRTNAE